MIASLYPIAYLGASLSDHEEAEEATRYFSRTSVALLTVREIPRDTASDTSSREGERRKCLHPALLS